VGEESGPLDHLQLDPGEAAIGGPSILNETSTVRVCHLSALSVGLFGHSLVLLLQIFDGLPFSIVHHGNLLLFIQKLG
jgi:hypothetical protein